MLSAGLRHPALHPCTQGGRPEHRPEQSPPWDRAAGLTCRGRKGSAHPPAHVRGGICTSTAQRHQPQGLSLVMGTTTTPNHPDQPPQPWQALSRHRDHPPSHRHGQADMERAYGFADAPVVRYRVQSSKQGRAAADPILGGPRWSQGPCAGFSSSPQAFVSLLAANKSQARSVSRAQPPSQDNV